MVVDCVRIDWEVDIVRQVPLIAHNRLENIEQLVELLVLVLFMSHLKFMRWKDNHLMHLLYLVKWRNVSAYESLDCYLVRIVLEYCRPICIATSLYWVHSREICRVLMTWNIYCLEIICTWLVESFAARCRVFVSLVRWELLFHGPLWWSLNLSLVVCLRRHTDRELVIVARSILSFLCRAYGLFVPSSLELKLMCVHLAHLSLFMHRLLPYETVVWSNEFICKRYVSDHESVIVNVPSLLKTVTHTVILHRGVILLEIAHVLLHVRLHHLLLVVGLIVPPCDELLQVRHFLPISSHFLELVFWHWLDCYETMKEVILFLLELL